MPDNFKQVYTEIINYNFSKLSRICICFLCLKIYQNCLLLSLSCAPVHA